MAINRISNVTIDDNDTVFGGYVYNIDYQTSGGESPSTLKLTLINEKGEYFIEPEDLKVIGTPTKINIGSKLSLKMFPVSYRFENSSAGRLLEIEYIDESISYLDKNYVGLNGRQDPYDNVILLGSPKYVESLLGISLAFDPSVYKSVKAPEILYTFKDLITHEKIKNILGEVPELTSEYNSFYKGYVGTLRQVFSAWANDLGFLVYWENSKLNILDLRNPDNYKIIKQKVDSVLSAVTPESLEESYSIRDTFVRGINSTFIKDGEVVSGSENQERYKRWQFSNVNISSIINLDSYFEPFKTKDLNRIKAAHLGIEFFLVAVLSNESKTSSMTSLSNPLLEAVFEGNSNQELLSKVGEFKTLTDSDEDEAQKLLDLKGQFEDDLPYDFEDYTWIEFYKTGVTTGGGASHENFFNAYKKLSEWFGKFFALEATYDPDEELNAQADWFHEDEKILNTPIGDYLKYFRPIIEQGKEDGFLDRLSVGGFLGSASITGFTGGDQRTVPLYLDVDAERGEKGYYIKVISEPSWNVNLSEDKTPLDNTALIIETSSLVDYGFTKDSFVVGLKDFDPNSVSELKFPSDNHINIYTKRKTSRNLGGAYGYISYHKTDYPEWKDENGQNWNFASANAFSVDVLQNSISEDFIGAQSLILNEQTLTYSNFLKAHEKFKQAFVFYQTDPFFSKTFTIPYIDLPDSYITNSEASQTDLAEFEETGGNPEEVFVDILPRIKDGLQSLNISIGENGVKATYTFGTENMKIRSSDFYIENYYDSRKKEVLSLIAPKLIISRGSSYIS